MHRTAKITLIVGGLMTFFGFALVVAFADEVVIDESLYYDDILIERSSSGNFTTPYNSSWYVLIEAYDLQSCELIQLSITDSDGREVDTADGCIGKSTAYRWTAVTTFQHQENETYSFTSSNDVRFVMQWWGGEEELEGIAALGGMSCFCGIIITFIGSVMALMKQTRPVGVMPTNANGVVPIQNNIGNLQVIQQVPTQTYMTQPTLVEENRPQSFIISQPENTEQELNLNVNSKEIKIKEESESKAKNFWDEHV